MTISELRDYLAKYVGEGKGDGEVLICKFGENPLEAECEIKDAVFLEWKDGDCSVVIEIGGAESVN